MTDSTNKIVNICVPIFFGLILSFLYFFGIPILASSLFIVGFYTVIVIILFFSLGSYIEELSVNNQIEILIDDLTSQLQGILHTQRTSIISNIPDNFTRNKDDEEIEEGNKKILTEAIKFGVYVFVVCVLFSILLWMFSCRFNYKNMMYHNFILLFFVVIVEIAYFFCLSKNYRILDKNKLYYNFYNELDKFSTSLP